MSFHRDRHNLKTGVQERDYWSEKINVGCDFVMVYGFSEDLNKRIQSFKDKGYVIHFMTGIAWGDYQDYLNGSFDGINHWDDAQMDQRGNYIIHGSSKDIPYMVPTYNYIDYIFQKLKHVVDLGVEAIHLEEPEFWAHAGYSQSFKNAFEIYYRMPWSDPYDNHHVMYQAQKLKAYLYKNALDQIAERIKLYAKQKYQRYVPVYIPTHSLLNYSQWKIMSPESQLIGLKNIDGFIAQIWTGTSREPNVYQGIKKERTFETALLEYRMMASFRSKNQRVWFLHDPIEDNPSYTWDNYQYNYEKTLVASLLTAEINDYEICPWPTRVFDRKLPLDDPKSTYISETYDLYLNQIFQMLGDMPITINQDEKHLNIALLMSDTAMYQRMDPHDTDLTFSSFYGLALPLVKRGVFLDFMTIEKLLSDHHAHKYFDVLIMSYDFIKPISPSFHHVLLNFLSLGKDILFVGSHQDTYHDVYDLFGFDVHPFNHLAHLFHQKIEDGNFITYGKGRFGYLHMCPKNIAGSLPNQKTYLSMVEKLYKFHNQTMPNQNYFHVKRGPYEIVAVMNESVSDEPFRKSGLYADLSSTTFRIVNEIKVDIDQVGIYYDLSRCQNKAIIGSTYRIEDIEQVESSLILTISGKKHLPGHIRLYLEKKPKLVSEPSIYDEDSKTLLIEVMLEDRYKLINMTL